jgi:serine O-acetyltransferase
LGGVFFMMASPRRLSLWRTIWADFAAVAAMKPHMRFPSVAGLIDVLLMPGTMAVLAFRLSNAWYRIGLRPLGRLLYLWNLKQYGLDLWPGTEAGPGLVIPHPVGVAIAARIGRNVRIYGLTQIGAAAFEDNSRDGLPTLGDECCIFSGAKIFGPVTIGDRAIIAANTLVLKSMPAGAVVLGSPARVVRFRGDGDWPNFKQA